MFGKLNTSVDYDNLLPWPTGKQVIVCAHRHVQQPSVDQRWGHGKCFTLNQNLKHSATWDPCEGREKNRWVNKERLWLCHSKYVPGNAYVPIGCKEARISHIMSRYVRCARDMEWIGRNVTKIIIFTYRAHEQWGYCQAGTSALLTEDNMALIGAPGPFTWRGTVFAVSVEEDFLFRDKTHYHTPVKEGNAPVDKYSYLGKNRSYWIKKTPHYMTIA